MLPASNGVSPPDPDLRPALGALADHGATRRPMPTRRMIMGLVHDVLPDEGFEAGRAGFLPPPDQAAIREQMGAAKVAIELCAELGRDSARHVERMANSAR